MSTRFTALSGHEAAATEQERRDAEEREQRVDYKMVTFSLGGKDYGIDIMKVKEIAKFSYFTYVPNTPHFVRGVYNLRGDIISVIDLRGMFHLPMEPKPEGSPENGLILRLEDRLLGVVVDEIDKVVGIDSETIQPPHPIFGDINIKYISGVVEYDRRLYIILDVERVFSKGGEPDAAAPERVEQTPSESAGPADAQEPSPPEAAQSGALPSAAASEAAPEETAAQQPGEHGDTASGSPSTPQTEAEKSAAAAGSGPAEEHRSEEEAGAQSDKAPDQEKVPDQEDVHELDFVIESLSTFGVMHVSEINRHWVERRFTSWSDERKREGKSVQFETQEDALAFVHGFFSPHTGELWSSDYLESVRKVLPSLTNNTLNVWNPGCGTGYESYSFTVLCKQAYPDAQIKVWASDNDLLSISTAPNLVFQQEQVPELYHPYMVSGSNGYSFATETKDAIVFEYHDVTHQTSLPELDVVLMRDLLSVLPVHQQREVTETAVEGLRQGGVLIPGAHEDLSGIDGLEPIDSSINAYRKVEQQGAE